MAEPNEYDPPRDRPWDRGDRDDDRPRRRRRDRDRDDDDFDDDRPRRRRREPESKPTNGLMIAGIVLGVLVAGVVVVGILIALLLPAVSRVRESAARLKDQNNLKQISLAEFSYDNVNGGLAPADGDLSWRVHLLPYLEQDNVYRQFDMDEPWDGPTNKRLASQRIPALVSASDPPDSVETRYRVFVGPGTLYEPGKPPMNLARVTDGVSNTIFVVEAGETVPWPQPKELQYDRNGALPPLGVPGRKGFNVAMMDGSVRFVTDDVSPDVIRGGIEPNDGRGFNP